MTSHTDRNLGLYRVPHGHARSPRVIHPSIRLHTQSKQLQPRYSAATDRVSHHVVHRVSRLPSLCKRRTQIHLQPIDRIHRSVPRMHLSLLLLVSLLLLLSSRRPVLVLFRGHQEHHRRSRRSRTPETRKRRQRHPLGDASSQLFILSFQPSTALSISAPDPCCYVR